MFMQPFVYHGPVYLVETDDGTDLVPADLVGPVGLPLGHEVCAEDRSAIWSALTGALADYVRGDILSVEHVTLHYGRLSAPGYADATDWVWADSADQVLADLESLYGDDNE